MPEVLLDSDILIDHLRGYLSIITVAELAAGQMRQAQEEEKSSNCWRCLRILPSILPLPGVQVRFDGNTTHVLRMP